MKWIINRKSLTDMDQSRIYRRIHFLRELGNAGGRQRKNMIRNITEAEMEAISLIARYIVNGSIVLLQRDYNIFRRNRDVFRQLMNPIISLTRRKNNLLTHHHLLPKLLREYYIDLSIIMEIRAPED